MMKYIFFLFTFNLSLAQTLLPTDKLALLKGVVTNFKGKPLVKEIILLENEKTKAILKVNTGAGGKFELLVPVNATYNLKYKNFTSDMAYTKMVVPTDENATYEVGIKIDPPKSFILENVYFDSGKSGLKPASYKTLNDLVEILKIKNTIVIEIQGHTDNVGKEEENLNLSEERAKEVRKYLISKGIKASRITAKGYGSTIPIAENNSEEGRSMNRRTSLNVIEE